MKLYALQLKLSFTENARNLLRARRKLNVYFLEICDLGIYEASKTDFCEIKVC